MIFYRTSPIPVPPSQGALKFWLDAQDLTVADGTEILTMNNKGALGGTFVQRSDISINGNPTADTIDGKRALSYAPNIDQGLISTQNTSLTTFTVLTLTRNEGNTIPGQYGAPFSNAGNHFSLGGYWTKFGIANVEGWGNYPYQYGNYWYARAQGDSPINTSIDAGTVSAIVVQYDMTLANPTVFYKIKKDSADFSTTYVPHMTTMDSGPLVIGGSLSAGGAGGGRYTFAGKIFEILVWEGVVDDSSIRSYLGQKYGGTW